MAYWKGTVGEDAPALVLSAGGMFGAWQAGVWQTLSRFFHPSVVAGASAGALNAWAIAGGVDPDDLAAFWLAPECRRLARLRPSFLHLCDSRPLHERIRKLHALFRPKVSVGVVAVELPALRPRLFRDHEVTWEHLAASCSVLLWYPQIRIAGQWYSDGGLLGAVPLWAAAEMGAREALALNALGIMPSRALRTAIGLLRAAAPRTPEPPAGFVARSLSPSRPLGSLRDAIFWNRPAVERCLRQGRADAQAISRLQCP